MIKINLASKKQGGLIAPDQSVGKSLSIGNVDLSRLKELPLLSMLAPLVLYFGANYYVENFKEEEIRKLDEIIEKSNATSKSLQSQINQYKETDKIKKSLDEDEVIIRTKLDTIKSLLKDRGDASSIMRSVSTSIPADTWLIDMKVDRLTISLRGKSNGFSQMSDFLDSLTRTSLYANVELKNSMQNKTQSGQLETEFEFSIKRK